MADRLSGSDWNFSARQKETGLPSDPKGKSWRGPTRIEAAPLHLIVEAEITTGRGSQACGVFAGRGFLMVDDFWGEPEWKSFELSQTGLSEREPSIPIEHPIFHCFYDLQKAAGSCVLHASVSENRRHLGT